MWCTLALLVILGLGLAHAQDDTLNQPNTPTPPPVKIPEKDKVPLAESGKDLAERATSQVRARIRVDVNLVLIPVTVTDPLNRLVTGLGKNNFTVYESNTKQPIQSFSAEDTPVTIGIIFDLSGSMLSKYQRARQALAQFLTTSNPKDEYFVIGFNDRPQVIVDYTSSVDDVESRMLTARPANRTALLDAIYLGMNKLKQAKYERKALLVISDGGDNRSRFTEGEIRSAVRESGAEVYAIGIFDLYAPTPEERNGPLLLNDICETSGGRMFKVMDLNDLGDIATRISAELRNQYVIGYRPTNAKHDGKWRKVKVTLDPPRGLPPLTVHFRSGYYAPTD
ncbi:MAG: VWA domain-containing protein [Acidobacteriaceae bacterium]